MYRFTARTAALSFAIALVLTVLPATAQIIPAGPDRWVTPGDGRTVFEFPAGDVESLCGAPVSFGWDRTVALTGVPVAGADWDTEVTRLDDADVSGGSATVPIQVTRLEFRSLAPHETPCGEIVWSVKAIDEQQVTLMEIEKTSERGGIFLADISVRVVFTGTDTSGTQIGTLYYTMDLPDTTGTPWSFGPSGPSGGFRPGIDENEDCIEVLRQKLTTATGDHVYFIENLIAQGKCTERQ